MFVTLAGMLKEASLALKKACTPMEESSEPSAIVTTRAAADVPQLTKAKSPMLVTLAGILTDASLMHTSKAEVPMLPTLLPIVTDVR